LPHGLNATDQTVSGSCSGGMSNGISSGPWLAVLDRRSPTPLTGKLGLSFWKGDQSESGSSAKRYIEASYEADASNYFRDRQKGISYPYTGLEMTV
jgi:hypothetical protein